MLFSSIKSKFVQKFNDAKPEGAGALAPRVGNYFIQHMEFRKVGLKGEVPIATVHWNTNSSNTFFNDVVFEIALSGLRLSNPDDYNNLNGSIISIQDVKINHVVENGATKQVLSYNCTRATEQARFTTIGLAASESFFGETKNVNEACKAFAQNAPYNVAEAEYWEGLDEPIIEDIEDDFDGLEGDCPA